MSVCVCVCVCAHAHVRMHVCACVCACNYIIMTWKPVWDHASVVWEAGTTSSNIWNPHQRWCNNNQLTTPFMAPDQPYLKHLCPHGPTAAQKPAVQEYITRVETCMLCTVMTRLVSVNPNAGLLKPQNCSSTGVTNTNSQVLHSRSNMYSSALVLPTCRQPNSRTLFPYYPNTQKVKKNASFNGSKLKVKHANF